MTKSGAQKLGRKLIEAISPENIETNVTGTNSIQQDSLNFYECAADTIESIDKLFLKSLELKEEPLLSQLRTLRSDSTWRLGVM